jgi:hypothetical protein
MPQWPSWPLHGRHLRRGFDSIAFELTYRQSMTSRNSGLPPTSHLHLELDSAAGVKKGKTEFASPHRTVLTACCNVIKHELF